MNNEILDIIISLVKGVRADGHIESDNHILWGSDYLLNQVLRQYDIPKDHYYVSERASKLWKRITSEEIMDYYYQKKVTLDKADGTVTLRCYKGSSSHYTEWTPQNGDKLTYRDVFHDEHIVPIKIIINELVKLPELNYENVLGVLDKIRVCKMLKEEDKTIVNRSNRSSDYKIAVAENYNGIVCVNVVTGEILK